MSELRAWNRFIGFRPDNVRPYRLFESLEVLLTDGVELEGQTPGQCLVNGVLNTHSAGSGYLFQPLCEYNPLTCHGVVGHQNLAHGKTDTKLWSASDARANSANNASPRSSRVVPP